jgi:hypothetical protein
MSQQTQACLRGWRQAQRPAPWTGAAYTSNTWHLRERSSEGRTLDGREC